MSNRSLQGLSARGVRDGRRAVGAGMMNSQTPISMTTGRKLMRPPRWLAVVGCVVLLMGCEAVGKALTEGGPEYRAGPQAFGGRGGPTLERLAMKIERLESEQVKLEMGQADLERQRDWFEQEAAALREELKAMRVGVVVPPPSKPMPTRPAVAPRPAPAKKPRVAAVVPPKTPSTSVDPEASKKALRSGIEFSRQGKLQEAEAQFLRAVELDPTNGKAHYALGFVYNEQNNVEKAMEAFRRAVKINPRDAKAHYGLGYIYDEKGMLNEAIGEFKKAIEINPNESRAHYNLGVIYEKKGMKEEAERELAIYNSLTSQ